jgi:hypothetical protein
MSKIFKTAMQFYKRNEMLIVYGMISVFVTVIDVIISWCGEKLAVRILPNNGDTLTNMLKFGLSNTLGVVTGFLIQYYISARRVFNSRNRRTFAIYFSTFLMGLFLANSIVFVTRSYIFAGAETNIAFLTAKFFSILIPFFAMYYIRKKLIKPDTEDTK